MIYLSLIYVVILHNFVFARRGIIDPVSVFFVAFLYYSYMAPIAMLTFNISTVDVAGLSNFVTKESIDRSAILFAIGYSGFAVGYSVPSRNLGKHSLDDCGLLAKEIFSSIYIRRLSLFVFIVILVISTIFRQQLIYSTSSYSGKISGNYENSTYAFLISVALTTFSLILNYTILRIRRFVFACLCGVILCFMLSILTYSKLPLIFAALCVICALHRIRRLPYILLIFGIIAGATLTTILFLPMFSIFRATGTLQFVPLGSDSVSLMIGEASSPFTIVYLALNGYLLPDGHPLFQSFIIWVPRFIWPSRPLDITEGFAQEVISNWQSGYGLGFSPFAEAYMRAGMVGSFFFMAMLGGVFALLQRVFSSLLPQEVRAPAILTVGGVVSVLVLRSAFSSLITQSIQNWVPLVIISILAVRLSRPTSVRVDI